MGSLQQAIDNLQERVESTTPTKKVTKTKKNAVDDSLPFSNDEMLKLEREMLGLETMYNEPTFKKKPTAKVVSPQKISEEKAVVYENPQEIVQALDAINQKLSLLDKKIQINVHTEEANDIKIVESPQSLEIVKMMISEVTHTQSAVYLLQTKDGVKEISLAEYYDVSKFITMLQQYEYSLIVDQKLTFEDERFTRYKAQLIMISQNLMANSFRFFERNSVLDEIIEGGKALKTSVTLTAKAIEALEQTFSEMKSAIKEVEYKKQFAFAKILNNRGLILNSITIVNEMLGEYIIHSARGLSPAANERIQSYIDNITLKVSSRKGYYKFYKSSKDFFRTHFCGNEELIKLAFFPHKDSGNEEIENKMEKLFKANKMNKSNNFLAYCDLIERVRLIRNDLAHGNISKAYHDISGDIDEILVDFNYLAIEKDILKS